MFSQIPTSIKIDTLSILKLKKKKKSPSIGFNYLQKNNTIKIILDKQSFLNKIRHNIKKEELNIEKGKTDVHYKTYLKLYKTICNKKKITNKELKDNSLYFFKLIVAEFIERKKTMIFFDGKQINEVIKLIRTEFYKKEGEYHEYLEYWYKKNKIFEVLDLVTIE